MKAPKLGYSDFGLAETLDSPNINEWMKEITARVNRLEMDVHGRHIPKADMTLTAKQAEVYQYICTRIEDFGGVTLREIAERFNYKGLSSAQRMVDALIKKKLLTRKGHTLEFTK